MDSSVKDAIKEALSITDFIGSYIEVFPSGKSYKARCPFHNEKTPSFYISPDKGRYKCFGCGKSGDIFTFYEDIEHVTFVEALKALADKAGISLATNNSPEVTHKMHVQNVLEQTTLIYEKSLVTQASVRSYLSQRGVNDETIKKFRIGFAPDNWNTVTGTLKQKNSESVLLDSGIAILGKKGTYDRFRSRLMFPICDTQGKVVGFTGRLLQFPNKQLLTEQPTSGKYVNTPESLLYHKSDVLYGFHHAKHAIATKKRAVVVEGQFDVVLAHQAGTNETVALSGTALTHNHGQLLARFTDIVILALDGDAAGIKALARSVAALYECGLTVLVAQLPYKKDPADIINESIEVWNNALDNASDYVDVRLSLIQEELVDIKEKEKSIRIDVYPLLASMLNPIDYDRALQKVSRILSVSVETIRADIARLNVVAGSQKIIGAHEHYYKQKSAEIVVGALGILSQTKQGVVRSLLDFLLIYMPFTSIEELANSYGVTYDDAVLLVQVEYANADLEVIARHGILLLAREYLARKRDELAALVHKNPTTEQVISYNNTLTLLDDISKLL